MPRNREDSFYEFVCEQEFNHHVLLIHDLLYLKSKYYSIKLKTEHGIFVPIQTPYQQIPNF